MLFYKNQITANQETEIRELRQKLHDTTDEKRQLCHFVPTIKLSLEETNGLNKALKQYAYGNQADLENWITDLTTENISGGYLPNLPQSFKPAKGQLLIWDDTKQQYIIPKSDPQPSGGMLYNIVPNY